MNNISLTFDEMYEFWCWFDNFNGCQMCVYSKEEAYKIYLEYKLEKTKKLSEEFIVIDEEMSYSVDKRYLQDKIQELNKIKESMIVKAIWIVTGKDFKVDTFKKVSLYTFYSVSTVIGVAYDNETIGNINISSDNYTTKIKFLPVEKYKHLFV